MYYLHENVLIHKKVSLPGDEKQYQHYHENDNTPL